MRRKGKKEEEEEKGRESKENEAGEEAEQRIRTRTEKEI